MKKELSKQYDPKEVEDRIYKNWEESGYFRVEVDSSKSPYSIVIPPPNITGQLHMGHALNNTLQDILIRWRRMQGYSALWLPGTDHASIATEARIVEAMKGEGLTKEGIGREKFLERAWEWKRLYGGTIISQLKKLGSSCDWSRERFTLDEGCNKAVNEVFVRLYNEGLIYRGERIINWCPHCLTSISDAEVDHEEKDGNFWHLKYPLSDKSGFLSLATTRPETMLGDTAVAVHPLDKRYKHLIGKTVILPLMNREIPIIADEYVEPEFGTGVVKITPAHDPNDFEVGLRHNLHVENVMTDDAKMNENAGVYAGLDRYEARKKIVEDLKNLDLLSKIEPIKHNVGTCYRCDSVVEPRISMQWYVKMESLAKPAIESVENGKIRMIPERFDKIYFNWMYNIKDWCISRQLWWGHRIPAWYCGDCDEINVSKDEIEICENCDSKNITRDPDTLDTWFSSALWPFSTLGWPDKTEDLQYFYPTNTLVTGSDIIFFWVARMIFSGLHNMGEIPFDTVLFNGLVRDANGKKMSKSAGNGIDPLEEIEKFGADALRFNLSTGNSPGNDTRYMPEKSEASRNFANKIWNAARFVLMNLEENEPQPHIPENLEIEDKWIITQFNDLAQQITLNLEKFELGIAVTKLYDFTWDIFCDWYIEIAKIRLQSGNSDVKAVLVYILSEAMKLLHPFMPFITEEIWQALPHDGDTIMLSKWYEYDEKNNYASDKKEFNRIVTAIRAIRARRAEMNIPPSKKAAVYIAGKHGDTFEKCSAVIKKLASASEVFTGEEFHIENSVSIITDDAKIFIPLSQLVDFEAEKVRINKELIAANKELDLINSKLSNETFISKAPQNVVDAQKTAHANITAKIAMLLDSLKELD